MGMNQYASHGTESRRPNSFPLICIGERHLGEWLWLGVFQRMSSVLATEKETSRRRAFASSFSQSAWRRQILPRYESKAAMRMKSSRYEMIRLRGILEWRGAT